jgi:cytochrome P450
MSAFEASACPIAHTDFDPYDEGLGEPGVWVAYTALQQAGGIARSEKRGGFWMMSRYDEVRSALRDPDTFSSASGHRLPTDGSQASIPIDFDRPLHTDYRKVMTLAVSPPRVREMRPFLQATIRDLLSAFREGGGGDFVRLVGLPLPLQVLTELVGFSPETVAQFRELTEAMWARVAVVDFAEARSEIAALMLRELDAHRRDRPDDFVTRLLDARVGPESDSRPLTEDEQARILTTFAVAGHETTMNASSTLAHLLASDPELQGRLRADPALAPRVVEEMLRFRTPSQNFARRTTCPVTVGDVEIPAGEAVLLSYAAANRDPARFPDPDHFDPDRDARGHLAFGWGIHQCMGAALARAELVILLETLREYPPLRAAGPAEWGPLQGGNHLGLKRLPLSFEES